MIETTILSYLMSALGDVPVFAERPVGDEIPDKYVVIEKTGSSRSNYITTSTVAFQSYGRRLLEALQLNERVKEAIDSAVELPEISAARLNSDYNFSDQTNKIYRYQAVYNITHY